MSTTSMRLSQSKSSLITQENEKATYIENKTPQSQYKKIHSLRFIIDPNNLELQNAVSIQQNMPGKIEMDKLVVSLISAIRIKKGSLSPLSDDSDDSHDVLDTKRLQKEKVNITYKRKNEKKHLKRKQKLLQKSKSVPAKLKLQQVDSEMLSAPELNIIYESKQPTNIAKYRKSSSTPTPKSRKPRLKKFKRIKRAKTVHFVDRY
eukprot:UN03432